MGFAFGSKKLGPFLPLRDANAGDHEPEDIDQIKEPSHSSMLCRIQRHSSTVETGLQTNLRRIHKFKLF